MIFVAKLKQDRPYNNHFREMEVSFTAPGIGHAYQIVNDIISALQMGKVIIIDLYRDDRAKIV